MIEKGRLLLLRRSKADRVGQFISRKDAKKLARDRKVAFPSSRHRTAASMKKPLCGGHDLFAPLRLCVKSISPTVRSGTPDQVRGDEKMEQKPTPIGGHRVAIGYR